MAFKKGDKVRVTDQRSIHRGRTGTVETVYDSASCIVRLDGLQRSVGLYFSELEPVDPEREALIELAETLDKARRQANASGNPEIESQRGVYGTIAMALGRTLAELVGNTKDAVFYATSDRVYDAILDGSTVREALAAVLGVG